MDQEEEQQSSTSAYENKEIEAFIESDYISMKGGETSRVLEFLKNREKGGQDRL